MGGNSHGGRERLQAGRPPLKIEPVALSEVNMEHPLYRVTAFEIVGPFSLDIRFDNGTERRIDFRPVLYGELYGPLRDAAVFNKVALDREVHTLVWPNGANFDPATLHDWPEVGPQMIEMARRWAEREQKDEQRRLTRG